MLILIAISTLLATEFVKLTNCQSAFCSSDQFGDTLQLVQPSVISDKKQYALYLVVHLNWHVDCDSTIAVFVKVQNYINQLTSDENFTEHLPIVAGVGFGQQAIERLNVDGTLGVVEWFPFSSRSGPLGDMPATNGDIFLHAKSDDLEILGQLAQLLLNDFPESSVTKVEETYGWENTEGRDLSGFIDGIANPKTQSSRCQAAIIRSSLGSYAITQRWIHNFTLLQSTPIKVKESWIGRTMKTGLKLSVRSPTDHVLRMSGFPKIVRQSQPWGPVDGEAGLFFLAYATDPRVFDAMLDRMTGHASDHLWDDVMQFTRSVSGAYWYFPSQKVLDQLARSILST